MVIEEAATATSGAQNGAWDAIDDGAVWRALSDPSRRSMLDLLRQSPMTTGELCESFEFSRFAVMKHLKVLETADLIVIERRGRERFNHLNPVPIQAIYRRWIRPFEQIGADRLLRLKAIAEDQKEKP
jgi:DNA-binding transcriptional ArsR family regulator